MLQRLYFAAQTLHSRQHSVLFVMLYISTLNCIAIFIMESKRIHKHFLKFLVLIVSLSKKLFSDRLLKIIYYFIRIATAWAKNASVAFWSIHETRVLLRYYQKNYKSFTKIILAGHFNDSIPHPIRYCSQFSSIVVHQTNSASTIWVQTE